VLVFFAPNFDYAEKMVEESKNGCFYIKRDNSLSHVMARTHGK